jgi:hypothetical protein
MPWRALLLLVIALCAGRVAPTAVVRAAPTAQGATFTNMRFYLNVALPAKFCAGQEYPIAVTPLAELDATWQDGSRVHYRDRAITGVPIKAEISNTSIATIEPPSKKTGTLELLINERADSGRGEVTFTLHARKAGTANLYLTAEVPERFAGGTRRYFGPSGMPVGFPIDVINCEYRVIVNYWWVFSGRWGRTWSSGNLNTKITASDPEFYGGDGSFNFLLSHFDIAGCSQMTSHEYSTHITARRKLEPDQLEVTFTLGPPEGTVTETCPNSFLLANMALSDPSAPWNGSPISFPASGGTKRFTISAVTPGGVGPPPAEVTITVQPIVATGGR